MTEAELFKLKYPVGKFRKPTAFDDKSRRRWINTIESFPGQIIKLTDGLTTEQLNWKYRPGGWMIKQVVHHCADSHSNSLTRFKLALTEDKPIIRPYYEDRWAKLTDSMDDDISDSILWLTGLHKKWVKLLKGLSENDLKRAFVHPEHGQTFTLYETLCLYAWHCDHHRNHIIQAIENRGRFNE